MRYFQNSNAKLANVIFEAQRALDATKVSADGADVSTSGLRVDKEAETALLNAINEAAFDNAKQNGAKKQIYQLPFTKSSQKNFDRVIHISVFVGGAVQKYF